MAITALPQPTILLLGSAQALTTPLSLVKELIDNALDAKARAIEVIISQNTLDKIEVRDSGHGIQKADLGALGRRCYTSKLRTFDELKSIGGTSLGFRGEALASAVQLGEVSITTKTDGETVATCVKLKSVGGIASQTRVAHPVGTTVCVKNFCSNLPVRKQTALKAASKTLTQLKELLQTYALARPTIRFSLKVAKVSKGSWSFSPRPDDGIKEAVTQIMGRDAAGECLEKLLAFSDPTFGKTVTPSYESTDSISCSTESFSRLRSQQFIIDLFLPKPQADMSKVGRGQFVSIDSRPVSPEKGTMRKIVALFKSYFKASLDDPSEKIKNPFLRLNINCPIASYDPNIEPAKDDVMFENESLLVEKLEKFFEEIYGKLNPAPISLALSALSNEVDDFEILLSRRHRNTKQDPETESISQPHTSIQASSTKPYSILITAADKGAVDFSVEDEDPLLQREEVEQSRTIHENAKFQSQRPIQKSDDGLSTNSSNDLNPWIITKLTASIQPEDNTGRVRAHNEHDKKRQSDRNLESLQLPVNNCSRLPDAVDTEVIMLSPIHPQPANTPGAHRLSEQSFILSESIDNSEELFVGDDASQFARRNDFVSARNIGHVPPPTPPPTQRQSRARMNRGLIQPRSASQDKFHQSTLGITRQLTHGPVEVDLNTTHQAVNPDLKWAMEYEQRKEDANRRQQQQFKAAQHQSRAKVARSGADTDLVTSSPHENRFKAAIANLEGKQTSNSPDELIKERLKTTLPDDDPRAYLMRRQNSESIHHFKPGASAKLPRTKSTRLPLERVPDAEQLQIFLLKVPTNMESFRRLASEFTREDVYVQAGITARGPNMASSDVSEIIGRINAMAGKWSQTKLEGRYEVEYDFRNLLALAN